MNDILWDNIYLLDWIWKWFWENVDVDLLYLLREYLMDLDIGFKIRILGGFL